MRMGQGVRTGLGHGGITCVLQTQFSSLCLNATIPLTSTLGNEYPSSNETSKKNGTVRGDCIACDALFLIKTVCCDPSSETSRRDVSDEASQHSFCKYSLSLELYY